MNRMTINILADLVLSHLLLRCNLLEDWEKSGSNRTSAEAYDMFLFNLHTELNNNINYYICADRHNINDMQDGGNYVLFRLDSVNYVIDIDKIYMFYTKEL